MLPGALFSTQYTWA